MLRTTFRLLVVGVLLVFALPALAAGEKAEEEAKPLKGSLVAPGVSWEGQQFVAADAKGRVYVFRPDNLRVYPLDSGGDFGEPRELESRPLGDPSVARSAAMDEHGDWVALFGGDPRWFPSGEEKELPRPGWMIGAVALLKGHPVALAYPYPVGRLSDRDLRARPPLVLQADRDDWSVLVESELAEIPDRRKYVSVRQKYDAHLLVDSGDSMWVANRYRYRVANYSSAGRELLVLEVDEAEVEHREEAEVEAAAVTLERERSRYADKRRATPGTNTAIASIIALSEGRDGHMYFLVRDSASKSSTGLVLDRFDSTRALLERVPLAYRTPGTATMAAGSDGLYVVPFNGKEKRYFVSWEALLEADWSPVEGVEMNGLLVEVARDEEQLGGE